jgi:hypothetical protein
MCAQLAASQATMDGAERVLALGRLSMSYTIGSVLGPALGNQTQYLITRLNSFTSILRI